jgi:pyruvate ferredoxin oxidoreductase alpha subunit
MSVEPMEPFFKEIKEPVELSMTGNYAVAGGVSQTDPDVICAFPITPQTQSVEGLSDVVNHGAIKAAFVNTESELAAACYSIAACAAGARTFTATASQGYLLMTEALPMAVGWRLPLTMLISARAFNSPNLNIWNSWEFTVGLETGWNVIVAENVQETYDHSIIASKIGEDTLFPTMFVHDGFIISHSAQQFTAIPNADVMKYTPKKPRHTIRPDKQGAWGGLVSPTFFMEDHLAIDLAKEGVLDKISNCYREFEKMTGRKYDHIETFNIEGKKTVFLTMGSMCGNILTWIKKKSVNVGLIKIRTWRPFPAEELRKIFDANPSIEKIIVLEKDDTFTQILPPVGMAVATALFGRNIILRSFIVGLGGRDVTSDEFEEAMRMMEKVKDNKGKMYTYLGVRETKGKLWEGQI